MPYIYLVLSVLFFSSFNILGGFYNRRNDKISGATPVFNLLQTASALICWIIIYAVDFSFDAGVLLYSLGFGLCYAMCLIGSINAIKYGSVMLTSLLVNMSLISATIWGLIFWNTAFTVLIGIGLTLIVIAIILCIYSGKEKDAEKPMVTLKWLIFALLAFFSNAACTIIQKEEQIAYNGEHGSMFMAFALIISLIVCYGVYLKNDKTNSKTLIKTSWYFPVVAGSLNTILNFFIILMASTSLSPSLIYPVLAVGSLMITILFSVFAFKEKLRWWQWIGFATGTAAVAILNLQ